MGYGYTRILAKAVVDEIMLMASLTDPTLEYRWLLDDKRYYDIRDLDTTVFTDRRSDQEALTKDAGTKKGDVVVFLMEQNYR